MCLHDKWTRVMGLDRNCVRQRSTYTAICWWVLRAIDGFRFYMVLRRKLYIFKLLNSSLIIKISRTRCISKFPIHNKNYDWSIINTYFIIARVFLPQILTFFFQNVWYGLYGLNKAFDNIVWLAAIRVAATFIMNYILEG